MSRITNIEVMGLDSSIIASGYPMRTNAEMRDIEDPDISRAVKLSALDGAHAQYLTGIRVNFDLTFSNKAWVEAERYRFLEFVSSQSTMHRVSQMDLRKQCNEYVHEGIISVCEKLKEKYLETKDPQDYLILLYNLPSGFELTARMTTNYRCLKNIYWQRRNHRLPEWRQFCEELKALPMFEELCILERRKNG